MSRLDRHAEQGLRELLALVNRIDLERPQLFATALPELLAKTLGADVACGYGLALSDGGLRLSFGGANDDAPRSLLPTFERWVRGRTVGWAGYNALWPEPAQRNRAIDRAAHLPPERSPIEREVLTPFGLDTAPHVRMLVCDGARFLGWFGAYLGHPVRHQDKAVLNRLASPLRRRLLVEPIPGASAPGPTAEALLNSVSEPAFLLTTSGVVALANAAGRAALQRDFAAVASELQAARRGASRFDVTALDAAGLPRHLLVVDRRSPSFSRDVALLAARLRLTARQAEVLQELARGATTLGVAATLGCSPKTAEHHAGAILRKAGVHSRLELLSLLCGARPA